MVSVSIFSQHSRAFFCKQKKMVKKNDDTKTPATISSIVQNLREVVRENDDKIARRIATIEKTVQSLRAEKTSFAKRVESLVADVETFASKTIAEERARDDAIREASILVGDDDEADDDEADDDEAQRKRFAESGLVAKNKDAPFTREGRAAISFLVSKFEEICEGLHLNLEFERLDEIKSLRARGALTSESYRLREISKAFGKLRQAYDKLQETWLSETLEQDFAQETMDVEEQEDVTDVETFVRDQVMDVESPTVADVLRLDTHDKARAFAEYLAE